MNITRCGGERNLSDDPDKADAAFEEWGPLRPPSSHLRSEIHNSAPGWWPQARQVILTQAAASLSRHKHPTKWFYSTPNVPGYSPNTLTVRHAGWLLTIFSSTQWCLVSDVSYLVMSGNHHCYGETQSSEWRQTNLGWSQSRPSAPSAAQLTLR